MQSSEPNLKDLVEETVTQLLERIKIKNAGMRKPSCDRGGGSQRATTTRRAIDEELRSVFGGSLFGPPSPVHSQGCDFGVTSPAGDGGMSKIPTLAECKATNKKAKLMEVSCDTDVASQASSRSTINTEELVRVIFGDDDFDVQSKPEKNSGVKSPGEDKKKSQVLSRPGPSRANPECVLSPADVSEVNVISDDEKAKLAVRQRVLSKLFDSSSRTALNAGKFPQKLSSSSFPLALNRRNSSRSTETSLQPGSREPDILSSSSSDEEIWLSSDEETGKGNEIYFFGQSLSNFLLSLCIFFFMSL